MKNNLKKLVIVAFIPLFFSSCFALHWDFPPICFYNKCVREQWKGVYFVGNKVKMFTIRTVTKIKKKKHKANKHKSTTSHKEKISSTAHNHSHTTKNETSIQSFAVEGKYAPPNSSCTIKQDSLIIDYAINIDSISLANKNSIQLILPKMLSDSISCIVVVGYSDSSEAKMIDKKIAYQRAQKIYNYLMEIGVPKSKLTLEEVDTEIPINEETEERKLFHRSVEIELY